MIGGMNTEPIKEIARARIMGDTMAWEKVAFSSLEVIQGRQCHSAISYQGKIVVFGGCFMFNRKRQVRECTNQVVEYDCNYLTINILKTKGVSIGVRKNHSAVNYKGSMVIYGGQSENGMMQEEMIVFHLDTHEWVKIGFKQGP